MFEARTSRTIDNAIRRAHFERAMAMRGFWTWVVGGTSR